MDGETHEFEQINARMKVTN